MNALCQAIADEVSNYPSKRQAALAIGTSTQNLDNWLLGRVPALNAELQRNLATFLNVSPRQILELVGFDTGEGNEGALGGSRRSARTGYPQHVEVLTAQVTAQTTHNAA